MSRTGCASIVAAAGAAFLAGWATAPSPAPPARAAQVALASPSPAPVPVPPAPAEGGCDALRTELQAQRQQNDELDLELFGSPLPWPDADARKRAEREYRQAIDEVLAKCLKDWSLLGLDCEEQPCIAALGAPKGTGFIEDLSGCEPWTRRYTALAQTDHGWRTCGEEDTSDVGLLAVGNSVQLAHPDVVEGEDIARFDNEVKRMARRFEGLIAKETACR